MQAPVETPENRASVISATSLPKGRYFSATVTCKTSSMPVPIGPPQVIIMMSPAFTLAASSRLLIAEMASRSEVNTLAGPTFLYTPSSSTTDGSMAVLFITEPSGAMFPEGNVTVLVRPLALARSGVITMSSGSVPRSSMRLRLTPCRRSESSHQSRFSPRVCPVAVNTDVSSRPMRRRCNITSGTPPAA